MTEPRQVLVPFEGSSVSRRALEVAFDDYPRADITALHVCDPITAEVSVFEILRPFGDGSPPGSVSEDVWADWYERATSRSRSVLESANAVAAERDRTIQTERVFGRPEREIVGFAENHGVDRIVMGSHGRSGIARIRLGSVAHRVVRQAPVPVLIVR